jgi:hypothetical protein
MRMQRYIEKCPNINLAETLSYRIWIHETQKGINHHYKFWSIQKSSIHPIWRGSLIKYCIRKGNQIWLAQKCVLRAIYIICDAYQF